jgi:hypothetical protein
MRRKRPSDETLVALRTRLEQLPERSAERLALVQSCADLHGVSIDTIYRSLREQFRPRALHRRDRGIPRKLSRKEMEYLCEVIAAMKLRTTNLKRRHLSTGGAIDLLIDTGIETPDGLLRIEPNVLTRSTVNRYLRVWGMSWSDGRSCATICVIPASKRSGAGRRSFPSKGSPAVSGNTSSG